MKKYLLSFAATVIAGCLYSQTVMLSQNFQGSTTGWTTKDNNGSGVVWVYQYNNIELGTPPNSVPFSFIDSSETNRFAIANAANATTTINTDLNSPVINCSGHSAVLLEFLQWFDLYQGAADGMVEVSTDQTNWTTVYDALGSSAQTDPELVDVDISAYAANQSTVYLKFNYATTNAELWWVVDNIKVMDYAANDVAVLSADIADVSGISNSYQVSCTFQNKGSSVINSVTLNYSVNGGTPASETLSNLGLAPFQIVSYTIQTTTKVTQPGNYPVVIYSSLPNGVADENPSDDSASKTVMFLGSIPEKNILFEEYTTAPCGYCPGGAFDLDKILSIAPYVIPVTLHTGYDPQQDPLATAAIISFGENIEEGAPLACIDRVFFPNNDYLATGVQNLNQWTTVQQLTYDNTWTAGTLERHNQLSPVGILASNQYDSATREVNISIFPKFYGAMTGDFRVSCYIVEDSITAEQENFYQESYYYETPTNTAINPWYQVGTLVNEDPPVAVIYNYVWNYVVRDFIGTPWGWGTSTFGSGNTTPVVDSQYVQTFTYTLPTTWNAKHVSLVAFVNEYNSNITSGQDQVLNSVKMSLNNEASNSIDQIVLTAVDDVPKSADKVSLYPNPAANMVHINYSIDEPGRVGFVVYNSLGQVITMLNESSLGQGSYTALVNTESFANGVYFLAMKKDNATVHTTTFVVSR